MFAVDFSTYVMIYLFLLLGNMLFVWCLHGWGERNRSENLAETEVFRCNICTHVYLKDKDQQISRCPRCNSLN